MKREWKVGELAKLAGLTVRTLRYYDQIGLFSPSGHTDSGYRIYTESDIAQLQQILSLKELGLSLDQVKSVIERKASWEPHLDRIGDFLDEYPDDDSQRRTK